MAGPRAAQTDNLVDVVPPLENAPQAKPPAANGARDEDAIGTEVLLEDIGNARH